MPFKHFDLHSPRHEPETVNSLKIDLVEPGRSGRFYMQLNENSLGHHYKLPVFIARGKRPGPVLGLSAMVHGNEVNGSMVIHRLIRGLDLSKLRGTVMALPVVNLPGYLRNIREFSDGSDLNRQMPGKKNGTPSQVYAYFLLKKVISRFDYLIDLHTASFGRVNSLYVRANLENEVTARMARCMHPQIIVSNSGRDGSLRYACMARKIPAITVEVGNPLVIQEGLVDVSLHGVKSVMAYLKMIEKPAMRLKIPRPVICQKSFWMYATEGGILKVNVGIVDEVKKGQRIATLYDVFGSEKQVYLAPQNGIIVGKSTNPICQTGSRLVHIGIHA